MLGYYLPSWNAVFAWAIEDKTWQSDVFVPCIQVGAKIKNPSAFVQGDAPIAGTPPPPRPHPVPRDTAPKISKAQAKRDRQIVKPTPPPPPQPVKTTKTPDDPTICQNFNRGKCTLNAQGVCPNDPARRHICSVCGKANHSVLTCTDPRAKGKSNKRKK